MAANASSYSNPPASRSSAAVRKDCGVERLKRPVSEIMPTSSPMAISRSPFFHFSFRIVQTISAVDLAGF